MAEGSNVTTCDSANDDFDFLGNESMKEIMIRMGDIDKVLAEITDMEEQPRKSAIGGNMKKGETLEDNDPNVIEIKESVQTLSYDDSTASVISDTDIYADDYGSGVANLQGELKEIENSHRQAAAFAVQAEAACAVDEEREQDNIVPHLVSLPKEQTFRQSVSVSIVKPTPDSAVGISMKSSKGVTRIVSILDKGLLVDTALDAGMELVEVNGISVTSARHARFLIQAAVDNVTFVARRVSITGC